MEEKVLQGYLYDFYGELLNEHQREIFEDYVINDLSLSEIAEDYGISRQGVHDMIKRCTKSLQEYEDKLHLVSKFMDIKVKISDIREATLSADTANASTMMKIRSISEEILEEL